MKSVALFSLVAVLAVMVGCSPKHHAKDDCPPCDVPSKCEQAAADAEVSARTLARVEKAIQTKDFSGVQKCDKCQACIKDIVLAKADFAAACKGRVMAACESDDFSKVAECKMTCGELAQALVSYKDKIAAGAPKSE
jgi:hypothetical protein